MAKNSSAKINDISFVLHRKIVGSGIAGVHPRKEVSMIYEFDLRLNDCNSSTIVSNGKDSIKKQNKYKNWIEFFAKTVGPMRCSCVGTLK